MNQNADTEIDKLVKSDLSKSAKIRALADLGLLRTEIRDLLGIRYQHVRKVLMDAGMEGGKQTSSLSMAPAPSAAKRKTPLKGEPSSYPWKSLLDCGFEISGAWLLENGKLAFSGDIPRMPGVYVFVLGDEIVYVGLTQKTLHQRMAQYRSGNPRQRTSHRVHNEIIASLQMDRPVQILTATPDHLAWNGLPVHIAPGLEAGLISSIKPRWNIQGH